MSEEKKRPAPSICHIEALTPPAAGLLASYAAACDGVSEFTYKHDNERRCARFEFATPDIRQSVWDAVMERAKEVRRQVQHPAADEVLKKAFR